MKPVLKWIGLALLFGLLTMGASCRKEEKKAVPSSAPKVEVKRTVEAFGIVKARDYKDINLDFPAQIERVPVKAGQPVSLGQPLIYLSINDFQAQIKNKENELNAARFELLKVEKSLRDAQDTYAKFQRQLRDKEGLFRAGAISQKELDDFRDVVKEKEKAVTDIKVSLGSGSGASSVAVQREKVAVLDYDLKRLRNKLNQSFLKGNVIVSDYANGVVSDVSCAAGYSVGTSGEKQEKLLSIMNLDSLYVTADVAEDFIKDVRLGAAVTIRPTADNTRKYQGKVTSIAQMAVTQNGETNVAVEISITNPDGFLRPNFNVDVEIAK
ncbi:CusB/HlyD membrane fusion family barrel-sandwich protein [Hydrogenispora ethanolica]|uniref:CusB/HlyD membrane fusion family barrel-sandwich protein n=1 Tax=Hydrogenispora ethanolica TaxID=1082276 RepID=A0A4R1RNB3_HYDET|nr:efflux RND transporter periplasmic adaptor subunit [Hydrogenispora ethanolica]TCL67322.1 CusB/HlyD membrane fusion family barrel-sandwich protein [Hydrogenispora ethanolica]